MVVLTLIGFFFVFILLVIMYNRQNNSEKIPKIIHQTAPSDELKWNSVWFECQDSWKKLHPDFEYRMWTDENLDEFMKTEFPDFYENVFSKYDVKIKRIDSARYFILYKYGGIYADMDYKCQHRFFESLPNGKVSVAKSKVDFDGGFQNALMISPVGHPFWEDVFLLLEERKDENNVILATGPRIISDCSKKQRINGLSTTMYNPYFDHWGNDSPKNYPNAKAIHMNTYSWDDEDEKIKEQKIPKQVFLTYKDDYENLPEIIKSNIEYTKNRNPEYDIKYYSDNEAEIFIKENFPQYLEHYKTLIPGAYKADLLRLLLLYKYGGVYNDIGHKYLVPIDNVIGSESLLVCKDNPYRQDLPGYYLHNAIIGSTPEHPMIKKAIEVIVENIENELYGENPLEPTGPGALGKAFNIHFKRNHNEKINVGMLDDDTKIIIFIGNESILDTKGRIIIKTKFENYYNIVYTNENQRYGYLWNNKNIYKIKFLDRNNNEYDHENVEKNEQDMSKRWISNEDNVLEIGCNYGTVSCVLAKLCNKLVAIDPDKEAIKTCKKNMDRQGVNFECVWGTVSIKPLKLLKTSENEYGYTILDNDNSKEKIPNFSIKNLEYKFNIKFNTLVVDCEGCMEQIFRDFDMSQFKKVIYERDNEERCNYKFIENILKNNGLKKVEDTDRGDGIRNICWK